MIGLVLLALTLAAVVLAATMLSKPKPTGGQTALGVIAVLAALFFAIWAFNALTPGLYL